MTFTPNELMNIELVHDVEGPRSAFRFAFKREADETEEVEDFIIAFYTEFNKKMYYKY